MSAEHRPHMFTYVDDSSPIIHKGRRLKNLTLAEERQYRAAMKLKTLAEKKLAEQGKKTARTKR